MYWFCRSISAAELKAKTRVGKLKEKTLATNKKTGQCVKSSYVYIPGSIHFKTFLQWTTTLLWSSQIERLFQSADIPQHANNLKVNNIQRTKGDKSNFVQNFVSQRILLKDFSKKHHFKSDLNRIHRNVFTDKVSLLCPKIFSDIWSIRWEMEIFPLAQVESVGRCLPRNTAFVINF